MSRLEIRLLGPFRAALDGVSITGFESNKVRALLAYLAAEASRFQPRERLAGLLWPDWPQKSAMSNLRYALADLRKNIADRQADPPFLIISREAIQLNLESNVWVDVGEFEQSALSIQQSAVSSQTSALSFQQLKAAIELYSGEFLEGFSLADSPAFEEWILAKREYYKTQTMKVLHTLVEVVGQRGEYEQALPYARRQLELEPWQEGAHQQVMRLLALGGKRSDALAQYEACQRLLAKELRVEPSAETTQLYEAIRDENIQGIRDGGVGPAPIPYPLSPSPGEPPSPPRPRHNLPLQLTSFIGREKEIAEVQASLSKAPGRLVTLTGAGGVGKTRLALRAAAGLLESFANGVWRVELAPLADPARVPSAVAAALDVHETPGRPAVVALGDYLRLKRLLLILDNCEHLAAACASLAATLLQGNPGLKILVTSRELLGVEGETTFYVPSLSTPGAHERLDLETVRQYDAVRLFVERAQSTSPSFKLTEENAQAAVEICQRLDGIPLAIELAAARTRQLSAGEIALRLNNAFRLLTGGSRTVLPRHQTLRALIDWSYNLLTPQEQSLLRALSVFAGSWTLEAAEAVCKDGDVLDGLGLLVDKSLVMAVQEPVRETTRYRMLETIRQYAQEKLVDCGEAGPRRQQHLVYFLQLAEKIEPEMRGRAQKARLDRLEEELDNLRLALVWALQTDPEAELRLASAMMWFWHIRTRRIEGLEWLEQGLALLQTPDSLPIRLALRAKALAATGFFHTEEIAMAMSLAQGDASPHHTIERVLAQGEVELQESLDIYRQLGLAGRAGMVFCLKILAYIELYKYNGQRAIARSRESLALARELGDAFETADCLVILSDLLFTTEQRSPEARKIIQDALALALEIGDPDQLAMTYLMLAGMAGADRQPDRLRQYCEQSLAWYRQAGNLESCAHMEWRVGLVAFSQKDFPAALEHFKKSVAIRRDIGNLRLLYEGLYTLVDFAAGQGDLALARSCLEEMQAVFPIIRPHAPMAELLMNEARLAWLVGDRSLADRKLAEAQAIQAEGNEPQLAAEQLFFKSLLEWEAGKLAMSEAHLKEALITGRPVLVKLDLPHMLQAFARSAARYQPEQAARLFGAADGLSWEAASYLNHIEAAWRWEALAEVRATLGEARMAELWAEGQAMTSDQAIAYALEEE